MTTRGKSFKKEKYQEQIKNEINSFLRTGMNDSRFKFVSVTKIELSNDFSYATVFWDTFDSDKRPEILNAIKKISGRVRTHLGQVLDVRHVPTIKFVYDDQVESEAAITKILEEEAKDKNFK